MKNTTKSRLRKTKWMVTILILGIATSGWAYGAKINDQNGVRVQVTPQTLSPNKPLQFKIRLTTHDVELDQDLMEVVILRDDQGRTYRATRWEGSPPGGHHRSGILDFPELPATTGEVTLIISDVGGVPKRALSWKIK